MFSIQFMFLLRWWYNLILPLLKPEFMIGTYSSETTKKLALRFLLENIDYHIRCLYLQEIISLGKVNDVWWKTLAAFFNTPVDGFSPKTTFSEN